eukprot:gene11739-11884_t
MCTSVIKDVIETTDTSSSGSTGAWSGMKIIPLPGTTKEQWMQIAPFLYPSAADVAEAAVTWTNLEAVLVLGNKYDMKGLMRKGSAFLKANSSQLDKNTGGNRFAWKWLKLIGQLGLDELLWCCIKAVKNLYGSTAVQPEDIEGLPNEALRQLLVQGCHGGLGRCQKCNVPLCRYCPGCDFYD